MERTDWATARVELIAELEPERATHEVLSQASSATAGERRTVVITGRPADHRLPVRHRQDHLPMHARAGFRPDRVAMWAVAMGILLLLVAAASSHAAVLTH